MPLPKKTKTIKVVKPKAKTASKPKTKTKPKTTSKVTKESAKQIGLQEIKKISKKATQAKAKKITVKKDIEKKDDTKKKVVSKKVIKQPKIDKDNEADENIKAEILKELQGKQINDNINKRPKKVLYYEPGESEDEDNEVNEKKAEKNDKDGRLLKKQYYESEEEAYKEEQEEDLEKEKITEDTDDNKIEIEGGIKLSRDMLRKPVSDDKNRKILEVQKKKQENKLHNDMLKKPGVKQVNPAQQEIQNQQKQSHLDPGHKEPSQPEPKEDDLDEVYDFEYGDEMGEDHSVHKKKVPLSLYRKLALSFIVLTLILLAVIFYFTFVKVTINITTSEEVFNHNIIVDVYDVDKFKGSDTDEKVEGVVKRFKIELAKDFNATGKKIIDADVTGSVNIINRYSKNQPLVATTRLLSPDGKLFRTTKTVNVPSQGTVQVDIKADKPGSDMAIEPTVFTIPGLWSGLQDKIYAESKDAFEYTENFTSFIEQDDIDNAIVKIKEELIAKAKKEVGAMYSNYDNLIYKINEDTIEQDVDGKVDQEVEKFSIHMKTEVIVVAFNNTKIKDLAYQKLISEVPYDKKLLKLNSESLNYNLNNYDLKQSLASLNVVFSGEVSFDENIGHLLEKEKLIGLTKVQLEEYLKGRNDISEFDVTFWPSFITKVPDLVDRIVIIVE